MPSVDALYNYGGDDGESRNSVLNHVNLIVCSFNQLVSKIETTSFADADARRLMLNKAYLMAYAKIIWPVFQGIYQPYRDQLLVAEWGNVDVAFYHFEKLTRNTVLYLRKEKLNRPDGKGRAYEIEEIVAAPDPDITWEKWIEETDARLHNRRAAAAAAKRKADKAAAQTGAHAQAPQPEHVPNINSLRDWLSPTGHIILDWLPIPKEFKPAIIKKAGEIWKLNNSHLPK